MASRIYIAATAIATVVVVGIAAAQETTTAPAPVVRTPQQRGVVSDATRAMNQAPVVKTPAERGVVTEDQPDQPGRTLEQRQLTRSMIDARTSQAQAQPGATLEQRQVQEQVLDQRGISLAERGLGDNLLLGGELATGLPAVGTAPAGSVPLFIDPNGPTAVSPEFTTGPEQFTTGPQQFTTGPQQFTTGPQAGAPTVIVIMPGPTSSPDSAGTGTTFVDPTTTVSPLFEASQQARRDAR